MKTERGEGEEGKTRSKRAVPSWFDRFGSFGNFFVIIRQLKFKLTKPRFKKGIFFLTDVTRNKHWKVPDGTFLTNDHKTTIFPNLFQQPSHLDNHRLFLAQLDKLTPRTPPLYIYLTVVDRIISFKRLLQNEVGLCWHENTAKLFLWSYTRS